MASSGVRSSVRGVPDLSMISPILLDLAGLSPCGRSGGIEGRKDPASLKDANGSVRSHSVGGVGM